MRRFLDFLREKGFYVALGVGVVAFAGLIFLYDYKDSNDDFKTEQSVDLNQSKIKEDSSQANNDTKKEEKNTTVADAEEKTTEKQVADNTPATTEEKKKYVDEPIEVEGAVEAESDGAYPDVTAGLNFDETSTLIWPVEGEVLIPFSMDTTVYFETLDSYKCNPGILIQGDEGRSVFSAYEGVVEKIEETKEYGVVVTVDLGNGYKAIYGQMMNLAVKEGDNISKAEIIGQIAPVSNYYKLEGSHLFFEITKNEIPINPVTLIQ